MITIHHTAEVPYPPHAVYALINDISMYPQFVPFCTVAKMRPIHDNAVEGTLTFAWLGIVESFTTYNVLTPPDAIDMRLIKGPFKSLNGGWKFVAIDDQTRVEFLLNFEFEFSNAWVDYILQPIFNTLSSNAMKLFIQRANDCLAQQALLKSNELSERFGSFDDIAHR